MLHSSPSSCTNISFPPHSRGNFHAWTLSTTVSGCLSGNLLLVWVQDWTMEKWCNNYFMAFILRPHVVGSDVTALADKGSSREHKSTWMFHSHSTKLPAQASERNSQFMSANRKNFRHLINSTSCVCSTCCQEEFMAKWFGESLIYLCFRCWNFLRESRASMKFSTCQHRISLQLLEKFSLFLCCQWKMDGKLHKSSNDVSSWDPFDVSRNPRRGFLQLHLNEGI